MSDQDLRSLCASMTGDPAVADRISPIEDPIVDATDLFAYLILRTEWGAASDVRNVILEAPATQEEAYTALLARKVVLRARARRELQTAVVLLQEQIDQHSAGGRTHEYDIARLLRALRRLA